jgi:hypothetical protein
MIELEQKILMWSLGFTIGVMTTIAVDKTVVDEVCRGNAGEEP